MDVRLPSLQQIENGPVQQRMNHGMANGHGSGSQLSCLLMLRVGQSNDLTRRPLASVKLVDHHGEPTVQLRRRLGLAGAMLGRLAAPAFDWSPVDQFQITLFMDVAPQQCQEHLGGRDTTTPEWMGITTDPTEAQL